MKKLVSILLIFFMLVLCVPAQAALHLDMRGGGILWGGISGTLSNQTDLWNVLQGLFKLDQTTPQHVINGAPNFDAGAIFNYIDIFILNGFDLFQVSSTFWMGLGSSAGRILFTDAATDLISVENADFQVTSGKVISENHTGTDAIFAGTNSTTVGIAGDTKLGDGTLRTVRPHTNEKIDLGNGSYQFNYIYGKKLYSNGVQINTPLTVYASGTAYSLTDTAGLVTFGTTSPSLTITAPGTYLLSSRARVDYNNVETSGNTTISLKLRRTNNTATDITNATTSLITNIVTSYTETLGTPSLPSVIYTTTNSDDVIELWGSLDLVTNSGSMDIVEAEIIAIRLY